MTLLLGVAPHDLEAGVLSLGKLLAASTGEPMVVVTVIPTPRWPDASPVDAGFRTHLGGLAQDALRRAKERATPGAEMGFMVVHARSEGSGLLQAARTADARMIVLGSADGGAYGRISTGSVSGRILHSSPLPVALAVRGDGIEDGARVARVSVAYGGEGDLPLVARAAEEAAAYGVAVRVLFMAVEPHASESAPTRVGALRTESAWSRAILTDVCAASSLASMSVEILRGRGWKDAVGSATWLPGEVLVLGGSRGSSVPVFLGSRGAKILRHAPVPVLALSNKAEEAR